MAITFGPQQERCLEAVREWLSEAKAQEGQQVFRLFGYAGTGKTTLAMHLGNMEDDYQRNLQSDGEHGVLPKRAQYCAYTGKAAVVMQRKGCENARTIHSLIYSTHDKSQEDLQHLTDLLQEESLKPEPEQDKELLAKLEKDIAEEKERLKQPGFTLKEDALTVRRWDDEERSYIPEYRISMFIIDECSMVDGRVGSDILSFKVPVLVLGDPAQLPPVGGGGYFTDAEPDFLLTEIHRQAEGDPIIEIATTIRNGGQLSLGLYGDSRIVTKDQLTQDDWLGCDQILCGKNATRHAINARVRQLRGFDEILPMPGERLVCMKNNSDDGLLNGSLWECVQAKDNGGDTSFMMRAKSLDDDREATFQCMKSYFMGLPQDDFDFKRLNVFNFGYALTVHKSQGSQWNSVILMDEWFQADRSKWLYTGVTRAAKSITVVRK